MGTPRDTKSVSRKFSDLPCADGLDLGIVRRPLHPVVSAVVGVCAVAVELAIGFVVLSLVADEVVERKAVVARHVLMQR